MLVVRVARPPPIKASLARSGAAKVRGKDPIINIQTMTAEFASKGFMWGLNPWPYQAAQHTWTNS